MASPNTALWRSKKEGRETAKKDLKAVQVGKDCYSVAQDRGKWKSAWNQNLAEHQIAQQRGWLTGERMSNAMCVGGGVRERMTRHVTSVRQKEEGQCASRTVLYSVRSAGGGFTAEVHGLAVHWCRREQVVEDDVAGDAEAGSSRDE